MPGGPCSRWHHHQHQQQQQQQQQHRCHGTHGKGGKGERSERCIFGSVMGCVSRCGVHRRLLLPAECRRRTEAVQRQMYHSHLHTCPHMRLGAADSWRRAARGRQPPPCQQHTAWLPCTALPRASPRCRHSSSPSTPHSGRPQPQCKCQTPPAASPTQVRLRRLTTCCCGRNAAPRRRRCGCAAVGCQPCRRLQTPVPARCRCGGWRLLRQRLPRRREKPWESVANGFRGKLHPNDFAMEFYSFRALHSTAEHRCS